MQQAITKNLRLAMAIAMATLVAALAWTAAAAPDSAKAQLPGDICDQYPELPECEPEVDPTFCDENPDAPRCVGTEPTGGPGPGGDGGPSADAGAGSGELPFTGYPLSPLLLLLLVLLTVGLAIRAYLEVRQRLGSRPLS